MKKLTLTTLLFLITSSLNLQAQVFKYEFEVLHSHFEWFETISPGLGDPYTATFIVDTLDIEREHGSTRNYNILSSEISIPGINTFLSSTEGQISLSNTPIFDDLSFSTVFDQGSFGLSLYDDFGTALNSLDLPTTSITLSDFDFQSVLLSFSKDGPWGQITPGLNGSVYGVVNSVTISSVPEPSNAPMLFLMTFSFIFARRSLNYQA